MDIGYAKSSCRLVSHWSRSFINGLAYVLYFRILATAGATNLLLVTPLIPVGAIVLGTAFLSETLAARHIMGLAASAFGPYLAFGIRTEQLAIYGSLLLALAAVATSTVGRAIRLAF